MGKETVLVIDDEKDLIELVRYNLEKEGFRVLAALDGEAGMSIATEESPDAVVVDVMLPGIDGLDVCRRLRSSSKTSQIPVIMLTAKSSESDRIVGLELGADDYVTKPFSPRELAARLKAVLRRASGQHRQAAELIRHGELVIDPERHVVTCGDSAAELTATEFRLLLLLATRPGRVFSRNEIINATLGRDVTVLDRTVDVHVVSLRRKLGECGRWIETVRGFGYRFAEENPSHEN
jgi:two-component system alkaline phosphatase synthesis response regulator PhoP